MSAEHKRIFYAIVAELSIEQKAILIDLQKVVYDKNLDFWISYELIWNKFQSNWNKIEPFLKRLMTDDEKWFAYVCTKGSRDPIDIKFVWWDWENGTVHHWAATDTPIIW